MKNSPNEHAEPKHALIFIPDISGFTRFVAETEITHSKHIIEELLEIIIDANQINLEISEIEGDAILFYRFGEAPTTDEMLNQVKDMFSKFHLHLKQYETRRICNCGACRTAHSLTIKFIAHYGSITMNSIRQYKKLFGKEVIVAHRLLKNDIDQNEYVLFTENFTKNSKYWNTIEQTAWSPIGYAQEEYDSGKVSFAYLSLDPLLNQLPDIDQVKYGLQGKKSIVLDTETIIDAPLQTVFDVVADLSWRSKWIPGMSPEVLDNNSLLTQEGQTHRCVAHNPVMISHDYQIFHDHLQFSETTEEKSFGVTYTLKQMPDGRTRVKASLMIPKSPVKELIFKLFMKGKLNKGFNQAWENLNQYCAGLVSHGENHPYSVQLQYEEMTLNS